MLLIMFQEYNSLTGVRKYSPSHKYYLMFNMNFELKSQLPI